MIKIENFDSENRELTDEEMSAVSGGGFLGDLYHSVERVLRTGGIGTGGQPDNACTYA